MPRLSWLRVKGLPFAYNKDLQETQEPLFDAADTLLQMLPLVTGWMKSVEFHKERMHQAAESGFMNAWAGATYLVHRGVPSRLAHERIGKAVQFCIERNCELQDLSLDELRVLSPAFDEDFYDSLKLTSVLAVHDVPGGTAPPECGMQLMSPGKESSLFARRSMRTRKAILPDAKQIYELIAGYSGDGTLLPRTLPEICENVRDFVVLEDDGHVVGDGGFIPRPHLAEIRSSTVVPWAQGKVAAGG